MAPRHTLLGLAGFFGAYFATVGVALPFWPVWLEGRGLAAADIGWILAVGAWVRFVAPPVVATVADRVGRVKPLLVGLPAVALLAYAGLAVSTQLWAYALLAGVVAATFSPLASLGEASTLRAVEDQGVDYGRVRLWGSLAFIATSVGVGRVVEGLGTDAVLPALALGVAGTLVVGALLPEAPPRGERPTLADTLALLRRPSFLLLLASAGLVQASHVAYYGFASIHWRAAGHSDTVVGALWAEGVLAEVLLFAVGKHLTARVAPSHLIAAGAVAGLVRWTLFASTAWLPALVAGNALHALTFGATHLGAMSLLAGSVPRALKATSTGLYQATISGLGFGLTMPVAGALYERGEADAFLFAAGLAGAGLASAFALRRFGAQAPALS
jgi:PPP family 3-phenylpropionic acid transporter